MTAVLSRLRPQQHDLPTTDAELVARAKVQPAAFEVIYLRYVQEISAFCLSRLGSVEDARDVTQETFERAFKALRSYEESGQFRAWLYQVARSVIANHRRAQPRAELVGIVADKAGDDQAIEDRAMSGVEIMAVRAEIARLPADQRDVIELRIAGFTGPEIARVLGRRHDSVRTLQHRAIVRLRTALDPVDGKEGSHGA